MSTIDKRTEICQSAPNARYSFVDNIISRFSKELKVGYLHVIDDDDFELPNYKKIDNETTNDDPNNTRTKGT